MKSRTPETKTSLNVTADKNKWIFNGLLILVFVMVYSFIFDKKLDLNGDNFGYINYARSIMSGHGYSSPLTPEYAATNWFPPGYSTMLAFLMSIFGDNIVILKLVNGLLYLGGMLLMTSIMKKVTGNIYFAFSVSVLMLLNSGLMRYATILMSEIPYLFFSILAVYYLFKMKDDEKIIKSANFYIVLVTSVIAFYFRSVGAVLAGAIIMYWLFDKKWKRALTYGAGFAVLYLPWMIRNSMHGLKSRYLDTMTVVNNWRPEEGHINTLSGFLDKMGINLYDTVIKGFTDVLFPFTRVDNMSKTLVMVLGLIIVAITFYGAWKSDKKKIFFLFYLLGNIFVFLVWHSGNGSRYVWPLAPFIAFCFFLGVTNIISLVLKIKSDKSLGKWALGIMIFALFTTSTLKELNLMAKQDYHPAYNNFFNIAKALEQQGNKNLIVACRKPDMFHYFSKTYAKMYLFSENDKEVIGQLVKDNIDFVVLDQLGYSSTGLYLYPAIMKNQELFSVALQMKNPDTYLLWFNKDGAVKKLNADLTKK